MQGNSNVQDATTRARTAPQVEGAMNVSEFARYMGVSRGTVYRWIHEGRLHPVKRGGQWLLGQAEVDEVLRRR